MIKIEISASSVVWYAAIVATLSFILSAYHIVRDRARVILKFRKNMRVHGVPAYKPDKNYFVITVINRGRRPVTITRAGCKFRQKEKPWTIASDSFFYGSRELREGKSTDFLIEQPSIDFSRLLFIWADDATGRIYKKRISYLPFFLRKIFTKD